MLKGIDPRLGPDVLHALRAMGHGDTLIVVDSNFPAASMSRGTAAGAPLTMENLSLPDALEAILSVLPLDTFVDDFAARMRVVDAPDEVPQVQEEALAAIRAAGHGRPVPAVERFAFYDLARDAFAIVQTGERRFYGCVMLRKGVIGPDE